MIPSASDEKGMVKTMKRMGRFALILMLCIYVIFGSGCSRHAAVDQSWRKISDAGKLKIGVYDNCFPMCSPKGKKYDGYDVDLITEIVSRLGLKPEFVDILESGKTAEELMADGTIDCAIGGIAYNSDLDLRFLLSAPYLSDSHVIVLPEGSNCKNLADIAGKTISLADDSSTHVALRNSPLLYTSVGGIHLRGGEVDALLDIVRKETDATFTRKTVAEYFAANSSTLSYLKNEKGENEVLGTMEYVILYPLDSNTLANKVSEAYATMERDSVIQQLHNKWFVEKQVADDTTSGDPEETALYEE